MTGTLADNPVKGRLKSGSDGIKSIVVSLQYIIAKQNKMPTDRLAFYSNVQHE